ncbi:esterase [Kitasatospora xanthocidica]|uniref:alpha/beta hydrolase family protein n=1 Tax=Kitasatospora xanthocidica TaxID=83382 RepID=UPI00199EDB5E|nr:acetylhydrolase [Kitasatospora xanthocidica]GHF35515.1 esterase [Kitasatospora xanthocidica]
MLRAALALGAVAPLGLADTAWGAPARSAAPAPSSAPGSAVTGSAAPARLTLPAPTGPYPVGMVPLHLRDTSRPDPIAGPGRFRELMATVWYPARCADSDAYPLAPWMTDGAMRAFLADTGFPLDPSLAPLTAGHQGAPVHRTGHRLPVIVFSHGSGSHRGDHTVICQELASHGYAVVTVDHTHDCFTQFPDGTVSTPDDRVPMYPRDYAADLRFLLDLVDDLAAGRNPDVDRRALPAGLLGGLDPDTVGAFGWSKGGTATALAMGADPRIRAGLAIDAPLIANPAPTADLDRPFMLMTARWARATNPATETFWTHLRGWRLDVQATGAVHLSYGDNMTLIPQAGKLLGMTEQQIQSQVGTLDPDRGIRIQQAYPLAFFDLHLRHRGRHLLDGPSAGFPEVVFHP